MTLCDVYAAPQTASLGHYWPNKMGRMIMLALEEVLSRSGVNAVFNLAVRLGKNPN